MMPKVYHNIETLFRFRRFRTREEYEQATGKSCPPWDPNRQPKEWSDPSPIEMFKGPDKAPLTMYDRVLSGKPTPDKTEHAVEALVISVAEAGAVNIPPKGTGQTNVPGADQPMVPFPLVAPAPNQRIVWAAFSEYNARLQNIDAVVDIGENTKEMAEALDRIEGKIDALLAR